MTISNGDKKLVNDKIKILLVDDDPSVLNLLELLISSFGYESVCTENGQQAVDLLDSSSFDIVISDVIMPEMDGLELLAHIQKYHPNSDVIMATGHSDTISYTDVIKAGASDFIAKPFSRDELEAKLNRIIREQKVIRELERLSTCDSLTSLYNRRYFDIKLWEEAHRAHRQEYPLFLAMVDVDRFKKYNDEFGHQAGDNVLQSIGRVITSTTRKNVDQNYRYGGDEFTIILPQTSMEQASQVAHRIVTSYHELGFGSTDLSIGLARFIRHEGDSWNNDVINLIDRADKAMYQAKASPNTQIILDEE